MKSPIKPVESQYLLMKAQNKSWTLTKVIEIMKVIQLIWWILPKELVIGALFTVAPFSRNLIVMGPFMSQKNVLYWLLCLEFFLYQKVDVFPLHGLFFQLRLIVSNPCLTIFWTLTCFSIHITHSSVNFTWFALLNHQKFDDRLMFKSETLFDLPPFWIASQQIF